MADAFTAVTRLLLEGALVRDSQEGAENPKWTPGTQLKAEVRAVLEPNRALLQIGQHVVDARLPVPVKMGERLALRVAEPFPKLVFILEPEEATTAQRTQVSMSSAARVIAEVIRTAEPGQPKPLQLTQPLPLPQGAAPRPEEIARSLKQAVERSGLFYEKHQARWVSGEYPLAELVREPQAKTYRPAVPAPFPAEMPRDPGLSSEDVLPAAEKLAASLKEGSLSRTPPEMPLRAQLDLIEGRPVMVAIPGWEPREVHWELPQKEQGGAEQEDDTWSTQLQLDFPRLGKMTARIHLVNDKLALALTAESGQTKAELSARQEALIEAFKSAGLSLSALAVSHRDE
ncbi:MAG: flagellar hook-length control protein FliK [Burkholderiales bacterium]